MTLFDLFLWGAAPYISFTILIVGVAIRRVYFERTWTAKSSEFLEKRQERIWTPLFHISLLFVFLGHLGGFLVPPEVTAALGITEHMYHAVALSMGGLAGCVLVISLIMLIRRRYATTPRMKASTSRMDTVMFVVLAFTIFAGMAATISNAPGEFDYRVTIMPWIRGIFALHPNPELMLNIPVFFKIHMVGWMVLFALIPFTRLVHLFSGITAPFKYLRRRTILYRAPEVRSQGRELEFAPQVISSVPGAQHSELDE